LRGFLLQFDVARIALHEARDPNTLVDLLDADALTGQDVGEADAIAVQAVATASGVRTGKMASLMDPVY
jgi:hypothetical protein